LSRGINKRKQKEILYRKAGVLMRLGKRCGVVAALLRKSDNLQVDSPIKKALVSTLQTALTGTPLLPDALCLDVVV
jgi:hypothetical protein